MSSEYMERYIHPEFRDKDYKSKQQPQDGWITETGGIVGGVIGETVGRKFGGESGARVGRALGEAAGREFGKRLEK